VSLQSRVPEFRRVLAGVLVACALGWGAPARAAGVEPAPEPSTPAPPDAALEARQQYQAGTDAYEAKRFVEAALHFEAAVVQRPHAVALYTAALAWEQANRPERAADDFVRALDVPGPNALSASQATNARDRLSTLEGTMGTLDVSAPMGWRIQLDANTQVLAPAHLHGMPGVHSLAVQPPSRPIEHRDVTLDLGKRTRLELAAEPTIPAGATSSPTLPKPPVENALAPRASEEQGNLRRELGFAIAGAGVASLAAGAVLGVSALSARDAFNAAPTQIAYDHATSLQTWTDVVFVAGGVLVAGGVALALWPSSKTDARREPTVSLAPSFGGAVVRGSF
jgi:hypothetical protein